MTGWSERMVARDAADRSIEPVLAAMRRQGFFYRAVRRLAGGAWGAWLVTGEQDETAILKCIWDTDWRRRLESARRVVAALGARGAPVPRYLAVGFDDDVGTWCVQQYLEGTPAVELDRHLLNHALAFNDLQAGLGTQLEAVFDWNQRLQTWMAAHAEPTIQAVERVSPEGARLAARLRGSLAARTDERLVSSDAVHGDFMVTQLLVVGTTLSGVIDWDAAGKGDRSKDLALLLYNAFAQADRRGSDVNNEAVESLVEHGVGLGGRERFGWFLAYEVLDGLAFVLGHNPRHIGWRTRLGLRVLGALGG